MRRLTWSIALAGMVGALSLAHADDGEPDRLAKAKALGTLSVSVYQNYPPYSYESAGHYVGLDVELAEALAAELGLKALVRPFISGEDLDDDLRNQVWRGTLLGGSVSDVMMHVGADPEYVKRQNKVAIFGNYLHETVAMVLRPGRFQNFATLDQLKGKQVAVGLGSISDLYLSGAYGGALRDSVLRFPTSEAAVKAFVAGEADALILPRGEMQGLMKLHGGEAIMPTEVHFTGLFRNNWDIGLAVSSDSGTLKSALTTALAKLRENGTLEKIYARYGLDYTAVEATEK